MEHSNLKKKCSSAVSVHHLDNLLHFKDKCIAHLNDVFTGVFQDNSFTDTGTPNAKLIYRRLYVARRILQL